MCQSYVALHARYDALTSTRIPRDVAAVFRRYLDAKACPGQPEAGHVPYRITSALKTEPTPRVQTMRRQLSRRLTRPAAAGSAEAPLLTLRAAQLAFGSHGSPATRPIDLSISPARSGGHVLLGANGSGKTLLAEVISGAGSVASGELARHERWNERSASLVSFESHQELLSNGGSVYASLSRGGTLSAAARFLVVRFGLHPLLYRPVGAISTGEIRKVLLARALSKRPQLLLLDNAFDGLDVPSRSGRSCCAWRHQLLTPNAAWRCACGAA